MLSQLGVYVSQAQLSLARTHGPCPAACAQAVCEPDAVKPGAGRRCSPPTCTSAKLVLVTSATGRSRQHMAQALVPHGLARSLQADVTSACRLFAGSVLAGLAPGALLLTGDLVDGKTAIGRGHQLKPEWEVRRARLPACTASPSSLHPPHSAAGRRGWQKRLAEEAGRPVEAACGKGALRTHPRQSCYPSCSLGGVPPHAIRP